MHIYLTLPNPLARLAHIMAEVERARSGGGSTVAADGPSLDQQAERRVGLAPNAADLEFLSLSRCEPPPARRSEDLDFASLSLMRDTCQDAGDSLGDLSLERGFPPPPR
jgi:hypothetical protein